MKERKIAVKIAAVYRQAIRLKRKLRVPERIFVINLFNFKHTNRANAGSQFGRAFSSVQNLNLDLVFRLMYTLNCVLFFAVKIDCFALILRKRIQNNDAM